MFPNLVALPDCICSSCARASDHSYELWPHLCTSLTVHTFSELHSPSNFKIQLLSTLLFHIKLQFWKPANLASCTGRFKSPFRVCPRANAYEQIRIPLTKLTRQPRVFNILFWLAWSSRCFALPHISPSLKLFNRASNRLADWRIIALQCCNALTVGQPSDAQSLLRHQFATVLTECAPGTLTEGWKRTALAYKAWAKRCVRTCGRKLYELRNLLQEISLCPYKLLHFETRSIIFDKPVYTAGMGLRYNTDIT